MDKTIPIKEGVFWISLFLLDRGLAEVVSPKIARGWIHFGLGVFGILYALGFIQTPSEPWLNRLLGASVAGLLIVIAAAVRNRFFLHGAPISDSVSIGQRLKVIENKITDPEPKAALSELRQEVERVRQPAITYENLDERPGFWPKSGERPNYVHLFFRNEETGGTALHAAAKLSWWDKDQKPLFSVDGKWQKAQDTVTLQPNRLSHPLDLFINKVGPEDRIYAIGNLPIDERYRLQLGIYKVRVTISCEDYTHDFWFKVVTRPRISVREYVSPDGDEALGFKDEFWR